MELAFGVVGGLLTGSYVASLLGAPVGRWWHTAVLPVLIVLGLGKLTMILGGAGQGTPSTAAWATAFLGPGPWGSLAPALPSDPSQAYEAIATLIVLRRDDAGPRVRGVRAPRRPGAVRWPSPRGPSPAPPSRPPGVTSAVVGSLNMGSLIAIGIGVAFVAIFAWLTVRAADDRPTRRRRRGRRRPRPQLARSEHAPAVLTGASRARRRLAGWTRRSIVVRLTP